MKLKFQLKKLLHGHDARVGRYEVFAPEGYHFDGGEHSKLCYSHKEAREIAKEQVTQCVVACACKEEA